VLVCLAAHELSHSLVARHFGVNVRDITLWMLGGIATIEGDIHTPGEELRVASAGPIASFAAALAALVVAIGVAGVGGPPLMVASALWLASINVILGVFNLVPAAPLDGGRVLMAILWKRSGDRTRATVSAARAGRNFAYALMVIGLLELLFLGAFGGLWFVLLGWFIKTAARSEELSARITRDLDGVHVSEVMEPDPPSALHSTPVDVLVRDYVRARRCQAIPIVSDDGTPIGLVTIDRIRALDRNGRATTPATDIAWPIATVAHARPDELMLDVLRRAEPTTTDWIVVEDAGRIVGIVSPADVTHFVDLVEMEHPIGS
jgi:Zn-dependent protease